MKTDKYTMPALVKLANGAKIYAELEARCKKADKSLRDLTSESKVSLATIWRMRKAKIVANLKPLVKLEQTLKRWGV